jgi:hypothetical protein
MARSKTQVTRDKSDCSLGTILAVAEKLEGKIVLSIHPFHERSIEHSSGSHVTFGLGEVGFGVEL